MSENNTLNIGFDIAELQVINLQEGDILSVKLIGDEFTSEHMLELKFQLEQVFKKNKVMVFAMPDKSDMMLEVIRSQSKGYCEDCSCGKKEQIKGESNESNS